MTKYADAIEDFYYISFPFNMYLGPENKVNYAFEDFKSKTPYVWPSAVSPSTLFDAMCSIKWMNETVDLGFSEQLYTARGSQGVGTAQLNLNRLKGDFDVHDYKSTLALRY